MPKNKNKNRKVKNVRNTERRCSNYDVAGCQHAKGRRERMGTGSGCKTRDSTDPPSQRGSAGAEPGDEAERGMPDRLEERRCPDGWLSSHFGCIALRCRFIISVADLHSQSLVSFFSARACLRFGGYSRAPFHALLTCCLLPRHGGHCC